MAPHRPRKQRFVPAPLRQKAMGGRLSSPSSGMCPSNRCFDGRKAPACRLCTSSGGSSAQTSAIASVTAPYSVAESLVDMLLCHGSDRRGGSETTDATKVTRTCGSEESVRGRSDPAPLPGAGRSARRGPAGRWVRPAFVPLGFPHHSRGDLVIPGSADHPPKELSPDGILPVAGMQLIITQPSIVS